MSDKPGTFQKGDKRINRLGRPKSFDGLRELAQQIAKETVDTKAGRLTVIEAIMRQWAQSKDPRLQMAFIQYAFGKVPDVINGDQEGGPLRIKVTGKLSEGN
jgi:hypothetical protein